DEHGRHELPEVGEGLVGGLVDRDHRSAVDEHLAHHGAGVGVVLDQEDVHTPQVGPRSGRSWRALLLARGDEVLPVLRIFHWGPSGIQTWDQSRATYIYVLEALPLVPLAVRLPRLGNLLPVGGRQQR